MSMLPPPGDPPITGPVPYGGPPTGPMGGAPLNAFVQGLGGGQNLSRRTATPEGFPQLVSDLMASRQGQVPGQQFFAPLPRKRPDISPFAHLMDKPPITNAAIQGLTAAQGGTPGGTTAPPPTAPSPGDILGIPGGGTGTAGGLTSAFDRPPTFDIPDRGGNTPAFDRPPTFDTPHRGDGTPAFDRPTGPAYDYRGAAPPDPRDPSISPQTPLGIFGVYQDEWSKRALRNLLHQGYAPQEALNQLSLFYQQTNKGPLGGPGPGNANTGTPPGTESSAGLASGPANGIGYGGDPSAGALNGDPSAY